jgi:hypothetical protein
MYYIKYIQEDRMSKFEPLTKFLSAVRAEQCRTSFGDIEQVLGFRLPPSARRHRPWWSNNARNSAMTKAWLAAGFKTEQVDMAAESLVFRRIARQPGAEEGRIPDARNAGKGPRPSLFGALKDTVRIVPGLDLTEPAGEQWAADQGRL